MISNDENTYWIKIHLIDNFLKKILKYNRNKIHKIFFKETNYNDNCSLIDIGTSKSKDKSQNIILTNTRNNKNICCLSNQDLSNLIREFPNVKMFIKGDAKNTHLDNNAFDIVYSSATIEHLGSTINQINFLKESYRVAKKFVFITTPNRYYPIDFHTKLPFFHWLPKKVHRKILKLFGMEFYSKEENLNLLDKKKIIKLIKSLNIKNYKIINYKFIFFTSNLIIIIKK